MSKKPKIAEGNGIVETKADKFRRLANARLAKAEKILLAIANLANANAYEYNEDQASKVVDVVTDACTRVIESFKAGKPVTTSAGNYV